MLNTTMAEMDVYHTQDLRTIAVDHLHREIREQVRKFLDPVIHHKLTSLPKDPSLKAVKAARSLYNDPKYTDFVSSLRFPSIYEQDSSFDPSNPHSVVKVSPRT